MENTTKIVKSASVTLKAAGSVMRITAVRRGDGTAVTYVTTKAEDGKNVRGMTEAHATFDEAKVALDALASKATKLGWLKPTGGFQARPDAFSSLPVAPKAKK